MVLVFRTNAGYERWWEARKLWGGITNQIRNLVIGALQYEPHDKAWREALVKWTIVFAFATKESLRGGKNFTSLNGVLTVYELEELKSALHRPLFVASKIASLLKQARGGHPKASGFC